MMDSYENWSILEKNATRERDLQSIVYHKPQSFNFDKKRPRK